MDRTSKFVPAFLPIFVSQYARRSLQKYIGSRHATSPENAA
jgi:hypothetical protein